MAEYIVYGNNGWVSSAIVGELIRCRDCKWWKAEKQECYEWYDSPYAPANGYCFRAERRDDDRHNDI